MSGLADRRRIDRKSDSTATFEEGPKPASYAVLPIDPVASQRPRQHLLARLRGRVVVRWVLAYLAGCWMVLQLGDVLADVWAVPLALQKAVSLGLGLGIFPTLVIAWYHGERGRQRVCCAEIGLVGFTVLLAAATVWRICFA